MRKYIDQQVRNIVIVGGGTAGWMTAAALAHKLGGTQFSIILVESADIGTIGVGEATLPNIRYFNQMLGIDEKEMMARTGATFKLGIEFCDWGKSGDSYFHPFGGYGEGIGPADFHHYWIKKNATDNAHDIGQYCLPIIAAKNNRFAMPEENPQSDINAYSYAFQFDATRYAAFLAEYAQDKGVKRIEGKVVSVNRQAQSGRISSVGLGEGQTLSGDLFVDCSGFRGVLIEQELNTGYEDWSPYLPCNRAVAVPCEIEDPVGPYTRATARSSGWQWRIPLQHRIGNGYVYCDRYVSDQEAIDQLMTTLEGKPLGDPKQLFFKTGKRKKLWNQNCVAIGLSGGFLEPLESTGIDLIQTGIMTLLELFPEKDCAEIDAKEYNRLMDFEYARVRDFLMLHYVATERDEPIWCDLRNMKWPESLNHKIKSFRERGLCPQFDQGLFLTPSWLSVFIGQNLVPESYDPRVDLMSDDALTENLDRIRRTISTSVAQSSDHLDFIKTYEASILDRNGGIS